jgi:predicted acyltransferase (DUF342 family)
MKKFKTLTLACLPAAMLICLASPAHAGSVGHWSLDDLAGSTSAEDLSGSGNNGLCGIVLNYDHQRSRLMRCPTFGVAGNVDTAANFNGSDEALRVNNTIPNSFTVIASFKTTYTGGSPNYHAYSGRGIIWSDYPGGAADMIPMALNGGHLSFGTGENGTAWYNTLTSTLPINTGDWVCAAVTRDKATGTKEMYINGSLDASVDVVGGTGSLNFNPYIVIGSNPLDKRWFDGQIDDVHFYDSVLSAAEIGAHCNVEISPFKSHAAISGGSVNIAAGSTVNGDLAAQAAVVIGANAVIDHNIYAGAAVTTGALSTVENIFSGAAAGIGANAFAQNIHAGAAITIGASSQVQAVYAGAAITLGAGASTNGVLLEDANADVYAEAGDIRNAGNMAEVITLITDTQSALSDLAPSSANGPLSTTMGTRTLAPGVWEGSAVSIAASSTITFDADEYSDNADHVWVINLSEALTVGASTNFEITGLGNGDTATIIWNVGAALNLGAGTSFRGTAFVGGAVNAATSSVSCGHLYATGAISIGSIGVDSNGSPVTCESSDAVFTYLEALD